jgi:HlyD family secretion protein
MKKLLVILLLLWGSVAVGYWYWNDTQGLRVTYRRAQVRRGDLLASINATGTLEPEEVVDVGAQVAGLIQSFGEDPRDPSRSIGYGSPVERGTVLARFDEALFKARVNQANAGLEKAEADVEQAEAKSRQAERELERNRQMQMKGRGMVSQQESDLALTNFESAKAAVAVAKSAVAVAKANLEEASVNLGYTTIRSPVKGIILDRRVNIGQTVIASLNAPSLFLIAKDLDRMEIWASVNETDVGQIHVGQGVRFSVAAFPHESFLGQVAQIRLNASMNQSVVTYVVVIAVDNKRRKLLPYLTAKVQFELDQRKDVLLVPNAALRWKPREDLVAPDARAAFADSLRRRKEAGKEKDPRRGNSEYATEGTLWVKEGDFLRPLTVRVGLSDGVKSEVIGEGIEENREIILGLAQSASDEGGSPFLPKLKNDKRK